MSHLRVIIAGGGTGGHIYPAVAIGHALTRLLPGTQLLFVGAKGKMEMEKVPQEGFKIVGLDIVGFNRSNLLKNFMLPLKLIKSRFDANSILREFKPDVVVGVGGFASFPVLNAAQTMGIPTLIQEQNSYAGRSNKILARKARAICVAYEQMQRFFPAAKIMLTGNPVRKAISAMSGDSGAAKEVFSLDRNVRTILVVGGSLGAKSINESVDAGLEVLVDSGLQVLWQSGKPYFERAKERASGFGGKVIAMDFIRNMADAYLSADIVISRAGALAIAELCIAAKPVIFVPYPYAAEDHQSSNAMALMNNKAAWMVSDAEAHSMLIKKAIELAKDEAVQAEMVKNLKQAAITDADERIANKIIELANR